MTQYVGMGTNKGKGCLRSFMDCEVSQTTTIHKPSLLTNWFVFYEIGDVAWLLQMVLHTKDVPICKSLLNYFCKLCSGWTHKLIQKPFKYHLSLFMIVQHYAFMSSDMNHMNLPKSPGRFMECLWRQDGMNILLWSMNLTKFITKLGL